MSEQDRRNGEPCKEKEVLSSEGHDQPLDILQKLETGELNVDDAIVQLQSAKKAKGPTRILEQLEAGEIDVQKALAILEEGSQADAGQTVIDPEAEPRPTMPVRQMRSFWLILFGTGLGMTAFGGWLGTLGGWWWLCAVPSLVIGILTLAIALATMHAPWLHLRVDTGERSWPQHIRLSFPVPIKWTAWALRKWGTKSGKLDRTAIDDLIIALEGNISHDAPLFIEVHEDESKGERIQLFLG